MTATLILSFVGCLLAIGTISGIRALLRGAARNIEQHVQTALGEQAADWNEPTRAQVEQAWVDDWWLFPDTAFADTPIFAEMKREEDVWFAASVLADIDDLPGGAA